MNSRSMKRKKLFLKSVSYSIRLLFNCSKWLSIVYLILVLASATMSFVYLFLLQQIINALTVNEASFNTVLLRIIMFIGAIILSQALNSFCELVYSVLMQKAEYEYNLQILHKLNELPLGYLDSAVGRDEISYANSAMSTVICFPQQLITIIRSCYTFALAVTVLFRFNVVLSVLLIIVTLPSVAFHITYQRKFDIFRRNEAPDIRKFSYYRWMLTDVTAAKDVRMYDLTEAIKARYSEEKKLYLAANKRLDRKRLIAFMIGEFFLRSGELFFIVFIVVKAIIGDISVGDITLYSGILLSLSTSSFYIIRTLGFVYFSAIDVMKSVFLFFEKEGQGIQSTNRQLEHFEVLEFRNVYFKYPHTEKYVLTGVSFTLNKGDKLSIVGINGSGKSTIIKLMLGLYEIESGQILINGYPMSDYDMRDVRKLFSALFQSFVQYPLTLRENIALSSLERIDDSDEIESVLRQSGVYEDIKPKLENGLDSFMTRKFDDKGTELSKGQWQKIALSRAYFKNAPIIIFDEPSAALDAEAEDRIFKNFESISDGKTGIMISHRISSARMSNKIIVLDGGKITEQGTHEELVSLNGLYAKLYNLQREKYTIKEGD